MGPRNEFVEALIHRYERYVAPFTFVAGFLFDVFTLRRIDLWIDHLVLIGYLAIAGAAIALRAAYESDRLRLPHAERIAPFFPVLMQFAFGGLFSAFVIFYFQSASVAKSWLFLLPLTVLLVGNERFRKRYERTVFQLSVFFVALVSYFIFAIPIFFGKIGFAMFALAGLSALGVLYAFSRLLNAVRRREERAHGKTLWRSVGAIYAAFLLLYTANIIPPAPLALKESGVYHSVEPYDGGFLVTYEKAPPYLFLAETSRTFHWRRGEPVSVFTAVFAPTRLETPIIHQWLHYDEKQTMWVPDEAIRFRIVGGRDGGYRGYSTKTALGPGKWRVDIKTETGQTLGRIAFRILEGEPPAPLMRAVK